MTPEDHAHYARHYAAHVELALADKQRGEHEGAAIFFEEASVMMPGDSPMAEWCWEEAQSQRREHARKMESQECGYWLMAA